MTIETKSLLARLLAEENITVQTDGAAKTASFHLRDRILTIPDWDHLDNNVYDLLIGHEVGHARFTPHEGWHDNVETHSRAFRSFLNVCEDARIEKKIQRKYPGLRKSFRAGYAELSRKDFFKIEGKAVSEFLFIDRANLKSKLGQYIDLKFAGEELELFDAMMNTETWEEVVAVAERIFEYCKKEKEKKEQENQEDNEEVSEASEGDEEYMDMDFEESEDDEESADESEEFDEKSEETDEGETVDKETAEDSDEEGDEPFSMTDEAFRAAEGSLASGKDVINLNIPNLDAHLYSYRTVLDAWDADNAERGFVRDHKTTWLAHFENNNREYLKDFHERNRNAIDLYVKEFTMRKSAAVWKKARVADTGDINTNRLSKYRMGDDIFKSRVLLPQGKNHGMMMLLDMSSSMVGLFTEALEQTMILMTVCKRVGIPYRVFGFSDYRYAHPQGKEMTPVPGNLILDGGVMELFSNEMSSSEMQKMTYYMMGYARHMNYHYNGSFKKDLSGGYLTIPRIMNMGSTPTVTALAVLEKLIPTFRSKNRLDKVNLVVMTDGVADCTRNYFYKHESGEILTGYMTNQEYYKVAAYNLKIGKHTYRMLNHTEIQSTLISHIRQVHNVNVIGMHIINGVKRRTAIELTMFNRAMTGAEISAALRTEKHLETNYLTFSRFFIVNINTNEKEGPIDFDKSWSAAKKYKAFAKSHTNKRLNRIVASKFMDMVA